MAASGEFRPPSAGGTGTVSRTDGTGDYGADTALIRAGGITGIIVAALAACLSAPGVCLATYGRDVLPVGRLSKGAR